MNEKLYEALDACLHALQHGADVDSVLARYPDLADKLRPILKASLQARTLGGPAVPKGVQRRGRARLLRRAAELRESNRAPRQAAFSVFPRLAVALAFAVVFFLSSAGLVSASSGALPGDGLYPVKRTWEDMRLLLVFTSYRREILESQFEQERLDEVDELLAEGRAELIAFSGLITRQDEDQWLVSGIPILVTDATRLPAEAVSAGAPVIVAGWTRSDGTVGAESIQFLQPGALLPPFEPSDDEGPENEPRSALWTPEAGREDENAAEPKTFEFQGVVENMQGDIWTINGQKVYVTGAEIKGHITVGAAVKFEGYYTADGKFIVTKIEYEMSGDSGSSSRRDGNGSGAEGGDDSGGDD